MAKAPSMVETSAEKTQKYYPRSIDVKYVVISTKLRNMYFFFYIHTDFQRSDLPLKSPYRHVSENTCLLFRSRLQRISSLSEEDTSTMLESQFRSKLIDPSSTCSNRTRFPRRAGRLIFRSDRVFPTSMSLSGHGRGNRGGRYY